MTVPEPMSTRLAMPAVVLPSAAMHGIAREGGAARPDVGDRPAARVPRDLARCTILLVDDEVANLDLLEAILRRGGYESVVRTTDAREAARLYEEARPDLVLLDLHMPFLDGFAVLADIRARTAPDEYMPVLVLTADVTRNARQRALNEGAHDFVTKPFVNAEVLLRVRNLLHTRLLHRAQSEAREAAERAERRAALLAEASRVLAASLDTGTALAQLARLVTDAMADRCEVQLLGDGAARTVAWAHAHGAGRPGAVRPGAAGSAGAVLDVPLVVSSTVVGRLVLHRADAARPFAAEEAALAGELAGRAALAVEYARSYQEARAATEDRERILAVVAHDLRTPLCALLMDAEMLAARAEREGGGAGGEGDGRRPGVAARMYRTARRLDGLIEDLLEVCRVDRGMLALTVGEYDAGQLLAEAEAMLRPLVEQAGLELHVGACDDLPALAVDDARVLQVIANLVGNAVKFTPVPGAVHVEAARHGGECRVSVRDTGPGIPPHELPHLFGAFWQARHADRRGLGLGLAIARGIVEAHGGRIWAESQPGQGTTFTFSLPLGATHR